MMRQQICRKCVYPSLTNLCFKVLLGIHSSPGFLLAKMLLCPRNTPDKVLGAPCQVPKTQTNHNIIFCSPSYSTCGIFECSYVCMYVVLCSEILARKMSPHQLPEQPLLTLLIVEQRSLDSNVPSDHWCPHTMLQRAFGYVNMGNYIFALINTA